MRCLQGPGKALHAFSQPLPFATERAFASKLVPLWAFGAFLCLISVDLISDSSQSSH